MSEFLVWLDTIAPLVALFILCVFYRNHNFPPHFRWLIAFLACMAIINGLGNVLMNFFEANNHIYYHFGNQLNFVFVTFFFANLSILKRYKRYFILVLVLFTITNAIYKIRTGNYHVFDSLGFGTCSIAFTLASLMFYASLLQQQEKEELFKMPSFWLVTGILLYYACCFFVFLVYRHFTLLEVAEIGRLWRFQNCMLAIMSIFIVKGFQCQASRRSPRLL